MTRAAGTWGTKRHAVKLMRPLMREWAKAKRAAMWDASSTALTDEYLKFGKVLGARTALFAVGALSDLQYARLAARTSLIIKAKVARRPLAELRCAA